MAPFPRSPPPLNYDKALNAAVYPFSPTQGKTILQAHGWVEHNGVMTKNGKPLAFTLNYNAGSQTVTDIVQLLKSDWAQEGIDVSLVSTPFDHLLRCPAINGQ
jgi:peptide/nickel transport system substrate-binding protein